MEATKRRGGPKRRAVVLAQAGRPYGTPQTLTERATEAIVRYIKLGDRPFVAAEMAGVPRRQFFRWMEQGEQDQLDELATVYSDFRHKIEAAQSYAEHAAVMAIKRSQVDRQIPAAAEGAMRIPGDWKAALAWLGRARDGWQERKEITGKDGAPLYGSSGFEGMDDDEINERLDDLQKRRRSPRRAARTSTQARTRTKASA